MSINFCLFAKNFTMDTIKILFWSCLFIIFYTYIGYGILLYILVKVKRIFMGKPELPPMNNNEHLPEITLLICAYNEEAIIKEKMENCNSLSYPKDKLVILWVTDGSTDKTNSILSGYPNVKVVYTPERKGKTAALNHGINHVTTPLAAFTDANTMLNENAINEIVRQFQNPTVGCVSGEKRVKTKTTEKSETASEGEGLYWKYESTLKKWDNELYSTMGAAGELFAIRTDLFHSMPEDTLLDDFIMSMEILSNGHKIAYTKDAYAVEYGSANMHEESKRKRRIAAGGLQSIYRLRKLLNPFFKPVVTFQYISHRVLRWSITPIALLLLIPLNIYLIFSNELIYNVILILQIIFYMIAYYGYYNYRQNKNTRIAYILYYFLFMNINVFRGMKYLYEKKDGSWEKAKRS